MLGCARNAARCSPQQPIGRERPSPPSRVRHRGVTAPRSSSSLRRRERERDARAALARGVLPRSGRRAPRRARARSRGRGRRRRPSARGRRARSGRTCVAPRPARGPRRVSSTRDAAPSPASGSTTTATAPSDGVCRSAFVTRFSRTRSILSGSQRARAAADRGVSSRTPRERRLRRRARGRTRRRARRARRRAARA